MTFRSYIIVIVVIIIIIIIIIIFIIIIIIIFSTVTVLAGVPFIHQPGANHAPKASVIQVIHSVHTLSNFSRIPADLNTLIFWVSVNVALPDTFLVFSTIPFFIVPSALTNTGITLVSIYHILCISSSRSLYLLFSFISFSAMFLSDGIVISISFFFSSEIFLSMIPYYIAQQGLQDY